MGTTYLVRGDTSPVVFTVTDATLAAGEAGGVVSLADATVRFALRSQRSGLVEVDATCVVTDAAAGICEWRRGADEPSGAGSYEGELEVTYADGTVKHFPDEEGAWLFVVRKALI